MAGKSPGARILRRARSSTSTTVPENAEKIGAMPQKPGFMGRFMGKSLTHEVLSTRTAKAQLGNGDSFQRSAGNYAKQAGVDASGAKSPMQNILAMGSMMGGPTAR